MKSKRKERASWRDRLVFPGHKMRPSALKKLRPSRPLFRRMTYATSLILLCAASPAFADVIINVKYDTQVKRIRPSPVEGTGAGTVKMVMHENGKIDDVIESIGTKTKTYQNKNTKLGREQSQTTFKVIDKNTILRTYRGETFIWEVKVTVDQKTCKAEVTYTLLPGQTEFKMFSPSLDKDAYYSEMRPTNIQCTIE